MSEVHASRRMRLRERCAAAGSAAALVSRPANIRYLTGWAPSGAVLMVAPAEDVLVHRRRAYGEPGEGTPPDDLRRVTLPAPDGDPAVAAADLAPALGADSLAVEEHHLTVARHRAIASVAPGLRLLDLGQAVEQLRLVKDEEEIACLRIAAEITDQALGELLESILVGRTERHLALELERRLADHGADGPAFPTYVGTGPHSGAARHRPTDRRVEEGDFLTVCLGACYRGYRCEVGRTFVIGAAPANWQIDLYDVVFDAQRAGREALAPGAACREVDLAARRVLERAGHGEAAGSWTGHGVGLEIDEDPRLTPSAMGKLDACVPVTVEPGVHFPDRGGVRIDDTLVVRPTADGGPELLTITTKELLAL
jgi:Xaa-Pro aminopeptidase